MADFHERILSWFDNDGRKDLPWQTDPSPYRVWVSEIMLQQTQVATVIPYFLRFMESFPGIDALASAHGDKVLQHWAGLGYYARARNLHKTAQILQHDFAGQLPTEFEQLLALPGIGRSTAGAILALSCGQRHPILDGNVKRVLARYHAVEGWPGDAAIAARLWAIADAHTPTARVGEYTQAIMDLGATVCTRSQPACNACPLHQDCEANALGTQALYPGKKSKRARPLRKTCMLLACCDGAVFLEKRPPAGIWGGLWSLPEVEEYDEISNWCMHHLAAMPAALDEWPLVRHRFSHYDLDIRPIVVRLQSASSKVADPEAGRWMSVTESATVGLATPVRKLVDSLLQAGM